MRICIQLFDAPTLTLDHGLEETQRIFDAMHDKNVQVLMHASTMEHLKLWSHHEKLAIIDQKIAFVGGIDLCVNRWEDENYANLFKILKNHFFFLDKTCKKRSNHVCLLPIRLSKKQFYWFRLKTDHHFSIQAKQSSQHSNYDARN